MRHVFAASLLSLLLAFPVPSSAQSDGEPRFTSYVEMRATLDDLMSTRRIADLLTTFGASNEMSADEMYGIQGRVRLVFRDDFENSAVMIRQDMKNGFHQELIAYWTGINYIYVRLFWHERPDGAVVALNMTFNSDPDELMSYF